MMTTWKLVGLNRFEGCGGPGYPEDTKALQQSYTIVGGSRRYPQTLQSHPISKMPSLPHVQRTPYTSPGFPLASSGFSLAASGRLLDSTLGFLRIPASLLVHPTLKDPAEIRVSEELELVLDCVFGLRLTCPAGPSTQYLRLLVPKTIPFMVFGTRVLKHWVPGLSGLYVPLQALRSFSGSKPGLLCRV